VVWALQSEARRFGELCRVVQGISEKMVIQHLKETEADGIVTRRDFKEVPPGVEYALTSFGESLFVALASLCEWGTLQLKTMSSRSAARNTSPHPSRPSAANRSVSKARFRSVLIICLPPY